MHREADVQLEESLAYFQASANQLAVLADFDLEVKTNDSDQEALCKRFLAALKTSIEQGEPSAELEELGVSVIRDTVKDFPNALYSGISEALEMLLHKPKVPCILNDEYMEMIAVAIDRTLSEHSLELTKEERVKLERELCSRASEGLSILATPREAG